MARVLIITYHFPPRPTIGSVRLGALAKHLPGLGWDPVVVTPELPPGVRPNVPIIETGYRDILADWKARLRLNPRQGLHQQLGLSLSNRPGSRRLHSKLIDWIAGAITYPDYMGGWLEFATPALKQLAGKEKFDCIITSSPPITAHLLGAQAKKLFGCPWIAELRDLWAAPSSPMARNQYLQRRLEKKTLSRADALVTMSTNWADFLAKRYPSKPVSCILTGFDSEDVGAAEQLSPQFTITYAGTLYAGHRDPSPLFQALQELSQENLMRPEDVRVHFYGPAEPWLSELIRQHQLEPVVELHGIIPREEVLSRQRKSQLLLLLGMNVDTDSGCYPGKLFEYLAARRPIIAIGGRRGATSELLEQTGTGQQLFSVEELKAFLLAAYRQYRSNGSVAYRGKPAALARYTHAGMGRQFADLLDRLHACDPRFSPPEPAPAGYLQG